MSSCGQYAPGGVYAQCHFALRDSDMGLVEVAVYTVLWFAERTRGGLLPRLAHNVTYLRPHHPPWLHYCGVVGGTKGAEARVAWLFRPVEFHQHGQNTLLRIEGSWYTLTQ